jgi:hypothetical protein
MSISVIIIRLWCMEVSLPGGPCIWFPSLTWKHRQRQCGGMLLTNALPPLTSLVGSSGHVSYVPWALPQWSIQFVPRRLSRICRGYGKLLRSLGPACPWPAWVDASKLGTATRYMDCLVREAIEIRLHPDNFNRDDGFKLSYAWHPIIKILQSYNSAPMANQGQAQVENQPCPPAHRWGLYKWPRRTLPYIRPWWWWWPRWTSKRRYTTYT